MMVVVTHSTFYAHERLDPSFDFWGRGAAGVDIFFVISGFVMYLSARAERSDQVGWREFLGRRLVRIFPLYWLATTGKLAILLATPALVLHAELDWEYIAKSYFLIPAVNVDGRIEPLLGVGWTLMFEMLFYVIFAAALALRVNVFYFCAAILIPMALLSVFREEDWPPFATFFNQRVLAFLAGIFIARALVQVSLPKWLSICMIGLGFGVLIWAPGASEHWLFLTHVLPAALIVWGVVALEPYLGARFPAWAVFGGAASYSLYLIHPLVAPGAPVILARLGLPFPWLSVALSIVMALAAAAIVYVMFEKPVTRRLQSLVRTLQSRRRAAA